MSSPWLLHSPFRRELLRLLMTHAHNKEHHPTDLIYIYACHESEQALCHLELQRLLGTSVPQSKLIFVPVASLTRHEVPS